ncbi:TPA: tail fiber assembly protein [Providencia alcalifaciens]
MNYYRHNETKEVYAYSAESVTKTERLTVLESLIQANEPSFAEAQNNLQQALSALNELRNQLEVAIENEDSEEEILNIQEALNLSEKAFDDTSHSFKEAESNYQPFKDEYDATLPVFFEIREKLKVMTKMTKKEIENHLNPPKSKEQHIVEAEMKKQLCADEAEKNIAILERKVRLGMAIGDDKDLLTAWEIYSIKVSDIDTSLAPDIEWPQKP